MTKDNANERVKRTYNLPMTTVKKLYELKSLYPTEDIESMVNKAIIEYHEKYTKD